MVSASVVVLGVMLLVIGVGLYAEALDGYGNANQLARFSNPEFLVNSSISDDGENVTVQNLNVVGSCVGCAVYENVTNFTTFYNTTFNVTMFINDTYNITNDYYGNTTFNISNNYYQVQYNQSLNTTDNVQFGNVSSGDFFGWLGWAWLRDIPAWVKDYANDITAKGNANMSDVNAKGVLNFSDMQVNNTATIAIIQTNSTNILSQVTVDNSSQAVAIALSLANNATLLGALNQNSTIFSAYPGLFNAINSSFRSQIDSNSTTFAGWIGAVNVSNGAAVNVNNSILALGFCNWSQLNAVNSSIQVNTWNGSDEMRTAVAGNLTSLKNDITAKGNANLTDIKTQGNANMSDLADLNASILGKGYANWSQVLTLLQTNSTNLLSQLTTNVTDLFTYVNAQNTSQGVGLATALANNATLIANMQANSTAFTGRIDANNITALKNGSVANFASINITGNLSYGSAIGEERDLNGGGRSWNATDVCLVSPANSTGWRSVMCVSKPTG